MRIEKIPTIKKVLSSSCLTKQGQIPKNGEKKRYYDENFQTLKNLHSEINIKTKTLNIHKDKIIKTPVYKIMVQRIVTLIIFKAVPEKKLPKDIGNIIVSFVLTSNNPIEKKSDEKKNK